MNRLRFYFLGPPRLERDGQPVEPDTRKATALLAYLALSGERPSRDWLAAFLWPDFDESRAKAALRRTLSALKTAVGPETLYSTREAISLQPECVWCDVTEFRRLLAGSAAGGGWETAVALYRDDFLSGFSLRDSLPFDDWQLATAQTLRRELETALETLVGRAMARNAWEQALALAHRRLALDPLREDAHCQLMRIYAAQGQPNAALRQYRECVRILEEELGVAPLAETTALYRAVQENRLPAPAATAEPPPPPAQEAPSPTAPSSVAGLPLVGRAAELTQIERLYRQIGPQGRLLALVGEAGAGKTRLAEQVVAWAQQQGAAVLAARCYEGEHNLAYGPIVQLLRDGLAQPTAGARLAAAPDHALREAARLAPELAGGSAVPPAPAWDPGAQNRFVGGVAAVLAALLAGPQPGILWLDDAHWLDSASLELLLFLTRRIDQYPVLLLLCWRDDELPADHPLLRAVSDGRRRGRAERLPVARLSPSAVAELAAAVAPGQTADFAARLHRETDGLAYFVVEYLRALSEAGPPADAAWPLPPTVRELLHARLLHVHETERQLLQAAAVIGRPFSVELAQAAGGRSEEEVVAALEGLTTRGLLREVVPGATGAAVVYDFNHTKLRSLAYDEMSLARRRLLHRRLADLLAESAQRRPTIAPPAAQIAEHYRQAGKDAEAAAWFVQAGDLARALYAHQEALHSYRLALALGSPDGWRLHAACSDVYVRLGDYAAALAACETAVSLAPETALPALEHKLAQLAMRQGAWRLAEQQLARIVAQYGPSAEPDALALLYSDWSHAVFSQGRPAEAAALAEQARALAVAPASRAQSLNILGILARHALAYEDAVEHLTASLALATAHALHETQAAALNNLALAEAALGRTAAARDHLRAALALCRQFGDRHREAAVHNNLADLYHQMGDETAAMSALKAAVALYTDIGGQPGVWQPEIWKLAEW